MEKNRKAVFFCSASFTIDSKYNAVAREAVTAACVAGYDIVSGGSFRGTMNDVCEAASGQGVAVIGVLPRFMEGLEHPKLTELIWTDTMAERKEKMREGTSLAVALPGGVGTLDELVETLCLAKLGRYSGKIVCLNIDGFYDRFREMLDFFVETNMYSAEDMKLISFTETVEDFIKEI